MVNSDVNKILNTFYSKNWSSYYEYHNVKNRKKNIWFKINKISEFNFVRDIITKDVKKINKDYEISRWITLLIYEKGDFFGKHMDNSSYTSEEYFVLTGGYLLDNKFKGGDFIIENKTLNLEIGELFTFSRNKIHEVKEVTEGIRYSLHFGIKVNKPKEII